MLERLTRENTLACLVFLSVREKKDMQLDIRCQRNKTFLAQFSPLSAIYLLILADIKALWRNYAKKSFITLEPGPNVIKLLFL
jgi:hypothetical protein